MNDPKTAERRRTILVQVGLTAIVVVFAVSLVLYIVAAGKADTAGGGTRAIRAATSSVITKPGSTDPRVVLSINEDFLCPFCGNLEKTFGPTLNTLIDSGTVAVDYDMVAILDRPSNQNYSSRAGAAAYCVADEDATPDKQIFRRFHAAMYAQQPSETDTTFPTNDQIIGIARQSGAVGSVPDCVNSGRYLSLVQGLAAANHVTSTPTVRINGDDYRPTTPDALVAAINQAVGVQGERSNAA